MLCSHNCVARKICEQVNIAVSVYFGPSGRAEDAVTPTMSRRFLNEARSNTQKHLPARLESAHFSFLQRDNHGANNITRGRPVSSRNPGQPAVLPAVDAIFALIVMVFATWTTNINNLYSASLSIARTVPRREPEASKPGQPLAPMS